LDDQAKTNQIGSLPVDAHVPHGLPFPESPNEEDVGDDEDDATPEDEPNSRTKTQRLQDYRDEMARYVVDLLTLVEAGSLVQLRQ
jgi:hypothetical protein